MSDTDAVVIQMPSRVPPPGDMTGPVTSWYQSQQGDDRYLLTAPEMAAVGHLRGWTHFGPICPVCAIEAKR